MNDLIQAVSIFSAALAVWPRRNRPGPRRGQGGRLRDGGDRAPAGGGGHDLAHPLCRPRDDRDHGDLLPRHRAACAVRQPVHQIGRPRCGSTGGRWPCRRSTSSSSSGFWPLPVPAGRRDHRGAAAAAAKLLTDAETAKAEAIAARKAARRKQRQSPRTATRPCARPRPTREAQRAAALACRPRRGRTAARRRRGRDRGARAPPPQPSPTAPPSSRSTSPASSSRACRNSARVDGFIDGLAEALASLPDASRDGIGGTGKAAADGARASSAPGELESCRAALRQRARPAARLRCRGRPASHRRARTRSAARGRAQQLARRPQPHRRGTDSSMTASSIDGPELAGGASREALQPRRSQGRGAVGRTRGGDRRRRRARVRSAGGAARRAPALRGRAHGLTRCRSSPRPSTRRSSTRARRSASARSSRRPAKSCACRSGRDCSAASSIRSAGRSTATSRSRPRRSIRSSSRRRRSSIAISSPNRSRPAFCVVDALFALGRGQRELIIGDRATGKTAIAVDTIINQKRTDMICVYVAVGQRATAVERVVEAVRQFGAPERCVFVVASAAASRGAAMDRAFRRHSPSPNISAIAAATRSSSSTT